ncbi:MazG family protein [Gandjariella thermophila]|uniref:Nucleoside triphosphate pyrophosphohydrolase n=1 Tax=Gandjariella thermophila TaxID=1931992 RepID=A0A4D4J5U7_9PSEU|nr:MazG family protein [Gandjariella thermophila]GDY29876.1 nucleoside triphosphate pyrophosphohydrolase [Gandjariella thermophila]
MVTLSDGCVVVLLRPRLGAVLPAAAVPALRSAASVFAGADLPEPVRSALGADPAPDRDELLRLAAECPVAVVAGELDEPAAAALHGAGAAVLGTPEPAGAGLLEAVAVMDRLRSPGGCPWDAQQTHDSLRQYLVEETYELLEAIEDGDRAALREELGDVLLQVLFHARMAEEDEADPFSVDDVARELVTKLVGRHPHVFAPDEVTAGAETPWSHGRWEELKQAEKRRESSVDGVALGQPALALAAKLAQRTGRAGLPADLLPGTDDAGGVAPGAAPGEMLFAVAALARLAGADPEGELRAVARRFAEDVRAAERAARAAGVDPAGMSAGDWRRFWPAR